MRILLVEDEAGIAEPLAKLLEKNQLPADIVYDGVSALMQAQKNIYDAIVLDVMLPEMDGFEVLRNLRAQRILTPVLMLTAKDGVEDRIKGLTIGADDYVSKPFYPLEVVARIKALVRRRADIFVDKPLTFADITLDPNNAVVSMADGSSESLTAKEKQILEILMKNAGNIISKEYLLDNVWGFDSEATDNTVEIYIHYLRRKLEKSTRARIVTSRGLGYALRESAK